MLHETFIILSYTLLGAGIKYIDQAYDLKVFDKKKANLLAPFLGGLMAYLIITDPNSTMIFFAIFLIVAITKKIDNPGFYAGTLVILLLPLIFSDTLHLEWFPFGILLFSGIVDELGNDWMDDKLKNTRHKKTNKKIHNLFIEKFFLHRFTMKLTVLVLALANLMPILYFFAFILFDFGYFLVYEYSLILKKRAYSISGYKYNNRSYMYAYD